MIKLSFRIYIFISRWKLDEDDGISKHVDVYTFDYEKALSHISAKDLETKEKIERAPVSATSK